MQLVRAEHRARRCAEMKNPVKGTTRGTGPTGRFWLGDGGCVELNRVVHQAKSRKDHASSGAAPRGGVSTPLPISSDTRSMRVLASSRPTAQKKRADSHRLLGYYDLACLEHNASGRLDGDADCGSEHD